jgi:tetratricopeptide (TPR) repeat protein
MAITSGALPTAVELGKLAHAVWTELDRPGPAASAVAVTADALLMLGHMQDAQQLLEGALERVVGLEGSERPTMEVLVTLGTCLCAVGQQQPALRCFERAMTHAEALSDWTVLIRTLNSYGGTLVMTGLPTVGVAVINAAYDLARREGVVGGEIMPLNNLTALQLYRDLPAARAAGEEGLAAARRHGERTNEGWLACNLSFALWLDGSWDEIDDIVEQSGPAAITTTLQNHITLMSQAFARTARGEPLEQAGLEPLLSSGDVGARQFAVLEQAVMAYVGGRLEEAADLAAQATDDYYAFGGIEDDHPMFWVFAVEFAVAAGRLAEARRLLHQVADAPQALVTPYGRAQLHRLRGLVLVAEGDDDAAQPELRAAIEELRAYGAPFYTARAELELAELLARAGQQAQARTHAEAAHETFSRLRARPWAERAAATASLASV